MDTLPRGLPADLRRLLGTDGGLFESFDRGSSWLHLNTLSIAEFYTVHVDDHEPYRIWGGTQDNASLVGPDPWRHVFLDKWAGGDGFVTLPDPTDPNVVYFEHQNGDMRRKRLDGSVLSGAADVRIRPRGRDLKFAWNTPLLVSHHAPATLYCAAQHVFRSPDRGDSWQRIGDDLGGGHGLVSLSESPLRSGLLYAGAGDGAIHVTGDDGETWTRAAELSRGSLRRVVASRHDPDSVYACLAGRDRHTAQLWVSADRGASWRSLADGLPPGIVNVVLEDPRSASVLYAGTRTTSGSS